MFWKIQKRMEVTEMNRFYIFLMTLMLVFGISVSARATLIDMGDGTIYDTDLQLSWLKNANTNGLMNWSAANTWADNLVFAGFNDWRLPTVTDTGTPGCNFGYTGTDCGYNVDTSTGEMAHLFYDELGNKAYYDTSGASPQAGWGLSNTGPFTNLQPGIYWSGTEYAPNTNLAWDFSFYDGYQTPINNGWNFYALAVRPGERSTSVPEPATLLLLGSGLAGVAVCRKWLGRRGN